MSRVIFIESAGVKLDYIGSHSASTGNETSHTFTGVNLGPSSASGITVFGVGTMGLSSAPTGLVVGGNAATSVVTVAASGGQRAAGLYRIASGGTASVTINTTSAGQWVLGVWKLRALQGTTPTASGSQSGASPATLSISLDINARGAGIAFLVSDNLTSNPTWSGLTTRNFVETSSFSNRGTGASNTFATAQTGLNISATTPSGGFAFVAASWR